MNCTTLDISGVNARMFQVGWLTIVTGVNARATNTRVARENVNTNWGFNIDNTNTDNTPISRGNSMFK